MKFNQVYWQKLFSQSFEELQSVALISLLLFMLFKSGYDNDSNNGLYAQTKKGG